MNKIKQTWEIWESTVLYTLLWSAGAALLATLVWSIGLVGWYYAVQSVGNGKREIIPYKLDSDGEVKEWTTRHIEKEDE